MAKRPTIEQLEQLQRDMDVTAERSQIPAIRGKALKIGPMVRELIAEYRAYQRLLP